MWLVMFQVNSYEFSNGRAAEVVISPSLDHLCSDSKQQEDTAGNSIGTKKMKVCECAMNYFFNFKRKYILWLF